MAENLIEKYGRLQTYEVVARFYDAVLAAPRLSLYFEGIDFRGLVDHQTAFLRSVMGGPAAHTPGEIAGAHRGLGITDDDFDTMIGLLVRSLERQEIEPEDIAIIQGRYRRYQEAVVAGRA